MNAGAALYVGGLARDLHEGIRLCCRFHRFRKCICPARCARGSNAGCGMILDEIIQRTRKRVALLPGSFPENGTQTHVSLIDAIRNRNGRNAIIAEIKCASPSRGIIRRNVDMAMMAGALAGSGCVALSVLTEPYYFGGTGQDIAQGKICSKYSGSAQGLHY